MVGINFGEGARLINRIRANLTTTRKVIGFILLFLGIMLFIQIIAFWSGHDYLVEREHAGEVLSTVAQTSATLAGLLLVAFSFILNSYRKSQNLVSFMSLVLFAYAIYMLTYVTITATIDLGQIYAPTDQDQLPPVDLSHIMLNFKTGLLMIVPSIYFTFQRLFIAHWDKIVKLL